MIYKYNLLWLWYDERGTFFFFDKPNVSKFQIILQSLGFKAEKKVKKSKEKKEKMI